MESPEQKLSELAEQLGQCMTAKNMKLASAESCTGGWLAKIITDISGSSVWFSCSVVSYSNEAKQSLLDVSNNTLETFGAVSAETVREMTEGLFLRTEADVAVSISGIAGPNGGSADKPVGLVWLSWGKRGEPIFSESFNFKGDRVQVRKASVKQALNCLLDLLGCKSLYRAC
ncbi:Nicotinamide-nucleotide amidase [hydrothermal vent metagenome]|uniref:Nicotinamide-nucleotide amidase n=1 Tax=hydrothermal vent metagenome TaxID=652676 RepID=A0A3B0WNZ9_9ZZZZ